MATNSTSLITAGGLQAVVWVMGFTVQCSAADECASMPELPASRLRLHGKSRMTQQHTDMPAWLPASTL
jgi:hypothetical protein